MTRHPETIAAAVRARGFALPTDVEEVVTLAAETNSPMAYAMVGDLIQLLQDTSQYELSDAEAAYLRAVSVDPSYGEGYTSLGYFYDAVLNDPHRARPFFEKAIAFGDPEAREGLSAVLERIGARPRDPLDRRKRIQRARKGRGHG